MAVVVARQHDPGAAKPGDRLQRLVQGGIGDVVGVERVARHQHGVDAMLRRQPGDLPDGLEPRLAQQGAGVARDVGERLAELPVGGVDGAEGHGADLSVAAGPRQASARLSPLAATASR